MARLAPLIATAWLLAAPALAQAPANPHDLSGVWMNDNTLDERMKREGRTRQTAEELSEARRDNSDVLTAEYRKVWEDRQAATRKLAEGAATCKWPGLPQIMTYPYPLEILHTPGRITFLFEAESQVRRIYMTGEHPPADELDPSYNGHSIGRWEGDVLVIDTVGFNDDVTIRGLPHSPDMKIVERIRWLDADTIEDEITIADPKAFVRPIVQKVVYSKRPDWQIKEYSCEENNRDAPDASGERKGGVVP